MLFLLSVTISNSNDNNKNIFSLGLSAGTLCNYHNADFNSFPGIYNCGTYENSSNFRFLGNIDLNYRLLNNFELFTALILADRSVNLSYDELLRTYDSFEDKLIDVTNRYNLDAKLNNIEISFGFKYLIANNFIDGPLKLISAAYFYFPINSEYTQTKEAVSPSGHVLDINGQQVLEYQMATGTIENRYSPGIGFIVGLQNYLTIGDNKYFTQELSFDYCFTDIVQNTEWQHYSINLLLGFNFEFLRSEEEIQSIDITQTKAPVLDSATIIPIFRDSLNPTIKFKKIYTDFHIEQGYKLLCNSPKISSIFFETNSSIIPDKYLNLDTTLTPYDNPVDLHHNILYDVIEILNSDPKAKIALSAISSGDENNDMLLIYNRIKSVKTFFINNGIDPDRIKLHNSIIKSNEAYSSGFEENQRVDIDIDGVLLTNFVSKNYEDNVVGYSKIELDTNDIMFPKKIKVLDLYKSFCISNEELYSKYIIPSEEYNDTLKYSIDYLHSIKIDTSIVLRKNNMPIKYKDIQVDQFLAVLTFEYNSELLSNDSKATLEEMVDFLPENITIIISGSADSSGSDKRNMELTSRRAENAKSFIQNIAKNKKINILVTEDTYRYLNSSPIGRFLNRSIRIKLKKED